MRFWDSSAVVALLVEELASPAVRTAHAEDIAMATWWGTEVECASALARLERDGRLDATRVADAVERLDELAAGWAEVQPVQRVRRSALRLLRVHPLRAADALQLAAALAVAEDHPASLPFVTLDDRLGDAAGREGFRVVP